MTAHALKRKVAALAVPFSTFLELTYRCNWRCEFCYNPRHSDLRPLARSEWEEVLHDLRELGTLGVIFTGGEPLANRDCLPLIRYARELGFAVSLFSNGSLVTEAIADSLAELYVSVEVSLHGATAEVHDRTTRTTGSFDSLWRGIGILKSRNVNVTVKTPMTRLNEHQVDEMIRLVGAAGVPYKLDTNMTAKDDGDLSPLAFSASREGIRYAMERVSGQVTSIERVRGAANCGLGRTTMAISPEGDVYPCMQWRVSALGNVRAQRLVAMWHDSPVRREVADISVAANDAMMDAGPDIAKFEFCPALAMQRTGDALATDPSFLLRARINAELSKTDSAL